ncbi:MAG: hypothetical protein OSJ42_07410 [Bacteroidales bacterium]|nr:hypothetical protein [Bacteroidales bacterium]
MKMYTAAAVARRLDMTERNVRLLRDKGVLTEYKPGLYDLQTVTVQYINFLRKKNPEAEDKVDYNTERAKLVRAKRESEELELQVRKNELHTTEDIEKALTDMLVNFRTKLMAIPAKLSPIMAKKKDQTEIFKLMKAAIDETLEELADFDKICKEDKENEG